MPLSYLTELVGEWTPCGGYDLWGQKVWGFLPQKLALRRGHDKDNLKVMVTLEFQISVQPTKRWMYDFSCSIDCCRIVGKMIPRLGRTPNDQFTLKGAKRVQADHAGTWWGGVGWNPVRGLLSRGDVGQDVQVQEYSFLQNLGLYVIYHIYSIFKIYYTLKNILLLGSICFLPMFWTLLVLIQWIIPKPDDNPFLLLQVPKQGQETEDTNGWLKDCIVCNSKR